MSFLKRAIKQGISKGIGDAVSKAVKQAVEPAATQMANKAAHRLDQMTQTKTQEVSKSFDGLEGAFSNLQRAAESYATEVSKSVKVCPGCGEPLSADKQFCSVCGTKLPEQTMAQGALCPACGKQNTVGTKYCDACGTKLPAAIGEELSAQKKMNEAMMQWDAVLPMYPRWACGGSAMYLEEYDPEECSGYFATVCISFPKGSSGEIPLKQYWEVLKTDGFRPAGRYPDPSHLYKKVGGICYLVSSEHAFDAGTDNLNLEFAQREPDGGFDYVKPEPKSQPTLKDLKDGFKDLTGMFRK